MLSLLGLIYGKITELRNTLYDKGVFDAANLRSFTVSVGNITAGGTGKTPLVAYIAELLTDRGETVCILTRGYGRQDPAKRVLVCDGKEILTDAATGGDEPVELAKRLSGRVVIIADPDRIAAGEWAKRKFGVTVFLLDDGFQHRKVKRDLDIVCIDATDPFGGGKMLPAGRLRESVEALYRTDVVVITRANLATDTERLKAELDELGAGRIFTANNEITRLVPLSEFLDEPAPSTLPDPEHIYAFCGIGNPATFFDQLRQQSYTVTAERTFADHHTYTQQDLNEMESAARTSGSSTLVTTAKDAVKLKGLALTLPCLVADLALRMDDEEEFRTLI